MKTTRLALVTAAATVVLMGLGSLVYATGSSLACPDWPLCRGQVMPAMVGGVLFEHGHRLLALFVGVLVTVLAVAFFRTRRGRDRWLAPILVLLVLMQAVLGGLTVIYRLPPVVSIAHLTTSMVLLALIVVVAVRARPRTLAPAVREVPSPRLRLLLDLTAALLFVQIVLGGLVRHAGAALACATDPFLCLGTALPDAAPARIQMLHRALALLVALAIACSSIAIFRSKHVRSLRPLATAAPLLVAVQIGLGVAGVVTALAPAIVSTHTLVAGLLWAIVLAERLLLAPLHPRAEGDALPAWSSGGAAPCASPAVRSGAQSPSSSPSSLGRPAGAIDRAQSSTRSVRAPSEAR